MPQTKLQFRLFLKKKCAFTDIAKIVINTLELDWGTQPVSIEEIFSIDKKVRLEAERQLALLSGGIR